MEEKKRGNTIPYLVFTAAVVFFFKDVLFDANKVLFEISGDAGKNSFTYLYHIFYGKGTWFGGMNYPYGEHVIFTDNQPLLSVPFSFLNHWLHLSPGTYIAIMYWLIALSFWLGMVYVYRILRQFEVGRVIAIVAAGCIIYLSPQVYRLNGHFALAYTCFLPLLFYHTLRFHEYEKRKSLVFIFLLCTAFALLHMYYLAIALMWMCGYLAGYLIAVSAPFRKKLGHCLLFGACISLSVLAVLLFLKLTDPATDRPVLPCASPLEKPLRDLFTSILSPIWESIVSGGIITDVKRDANDPAYIGFALDLMMISGCIVWIKSKIRKEQFPIRFSAAWLIAALLTLLYALYIQYLWNWGMLKQLLQPLRQFRAPERISWICYFIISVYAAVVLDYLFKTFYAGKRKYIAFLIAIPVLGIWMIEANGQLLYYRQQTVNLRSNYDRFFFTNGSDWKQFLNTKRLDPQNFQAILSLPYTNVGSEKLWVHESESAGLSSAYRAGLNLHLPLMDVWMSRTSWGQTFRQVKIASGMYGQKPVLEEINDKPLLVLYYSYIPLDQDESAIIASSDYIGEFDDCKVYIFYPRKFVSRQHALMEDALGITARQKSMDTIIGDPSCCFINHYETDRSAFLFAGQGSMKAIPPGDTMILSWVIPPRDSAAEYEFSTWARLPEWNHQSCYFSIVFKDSAGRELSHVDALGKYSVDNAGAYWFRINKFFSVSPDCHHIEVRVFSYEDTNYLALDETLIRPAGTLVISKFPDGKILINNHLAGKSP